MANQLTIQDQDRLKEVIDDLSKWQEDVPEDEYFPKEAQLEIRNGRCLGTILIAVERLIDTFIRLGREIWAERVAKQKADLSSKVEAVQNSIDKGEYPEWIIVDLQTSCIELTGTLESILGPGEHAKQPPTGAGSGMNSPKKRAPGMLNKQVGEFLKSSPEATSREIAESLSTTHHKVTPTAARTVRGTKSWKQKHKNRRRKE